MKIVQLPARHPESTLVLKPRVSLTRQTLSNCEKKKNIGHSRFKRKLRHREVKMLGQTAKKRSEYTIKPERSKRRGRAL